jgi:hypothetical protein
MNHITSIIIILGTFFSIFIIFYQAHLIKKKDAQLRDNVFNHKFITYKDFEKNWITAKYGKQGISGYKYMDTPGCYIILIFDNPVIDDNFSNYINIYIGQSVNVFKRVHNHFNGKGNGDIYADIKYGKAAYVQFATCDKSQMNQVEKRLIQAFNSTSSYNKTRGGAKTNY